MPSFVSIIIPAYNAAAYIREAIQSALDQSHRELEIIVVDDGSSDGTGAIVRSFPDMRLRLVRQENRGQSAALNHGIRESSGDFIKFLDADDWLNPEHISAQLKVLQGSEDYVASCRWGYFVTGPQSVRPRDEYTNRSYSSSVDWLVDSLTRDEGMMGGWMWLIPRPVLLRAGGWDEELSLNNDFDFSIRVLLGSSGVRYAPAAIYSYRKGLSSALSARTGAAAMRSAFLTTERGCRNLLAREDSDRIRQICADRWQEWLYRFYPEFPDLAVAAETYVAALGGSHVRLCGGLILNLILPVLGWKGVRLLQTAARSFGWNSMLSWKTRRRINQLLTGN